MNVSRLKKYASLIVRTGVNVQKGQEVYISAELDQPEFVKMVTDECYRAGAKKVTVDFNYEPLTRSHVRYCSADVLGSLDDWQIKKWERQAEILPCKIYLMSDDPDALDGVDPKKYAKAMAQRSKTIKPIRAKMENKYQWCIAAVPGKAWAKKVFPELHVGAAVEALWNAILSASRVDDDPIARWDEHNESLAKKCDYLNDLEITEIRITSSNGTNIRIGHDPRVKFCGGGEHAQLSGIYFNPNIPTEEVFTTPIRGKAEGIVYSSRPLCANGSLIDEFWIRFEDGRAVEVGAKQNEDVLRELIASDDGAAYLGEVALVPYSSPIRESGLLFYNTLFDENAACHLALGRGFTNLLEGYETMTEEQAHSEGMINDSVIHEDFMIGCADTTVTVTTSDGNRIAVFKDGEWAI